MDYDISFGPFNSSSNNSLLNTRVEIRIGWNEMQKVESFSSPLHIVLFTSLHHHSSSDYYCKNIYVLPIGADILMK